MRQPSLLERPRATEVWQTARMELLALQKGVNASREGPSTEQKVREGRKLGGKSGPLHVQSKRYIYSLISRLVPSDGMPQHPGEKPESLSKHPIRNAQRISSTIAVYRASD